MKNLKKIATFFAISLALFGTSCSSENGFETTDDGDQSVNFDLSGNLESDRVLDPSQQYSLIGTFTVKSGSKLTIPAGTIIVSEVGTDKYIAVEQGGEIDIQGTANLPVVMRSATGSPGDWGGLLLCGEAITSAGIGAIAEVGGLIYGGTNASDSSGNIDYLIIEGAGAQITTDSQYNGLTLYAVGSGTTIDNVALINGADDGVEFFGGSVSVTNLYLENNEDDAVDWTEGWNGAITNTYVLHTIDGFSTAIEADKDNNNPTITNFTAVSETGGTGLQFKKESGATMTNVLLTGYDTNVDMKDMGPVENIIIDGVPMSTSEDDVFNGTEVDISGWFWINAR